MSWSGTEVLTPFGKMAGRLYLGLLSTTMGVRSWGLSPHTVLGRRPSLEGTWWAQFLIQPLFQPLARSEDVNMPNKRAAFPFRGTRFNEDSDFNEDINFPVDVPPRPQITRRGYLHNPIELSCIYWPWTSSPWTRSRRKKFPRTIQYFIFR